MREPSKFLADVAPICPPELLELAQSSDRPKVAIANAGAPLPMQAALAATQAGIMEPVFVGDPAEIHAQADQLNWDISEYHMAEAIGEVAAAAKAANICGVGQADVLMKGQLHTDVFLKGALSRDAGLRTGNRLVHIFHISHPAGGRPLMLSDAAVNVTPDIATRQDATRAVVDLLHRLGTKRPKIAYLSATETPINSVPSSLDARELQNWAAAHIQNADFSGPLALDLILSPEATRIKGLSDDAVAGQADAVIVPDLVTGNSLFKALVYLTGACAAGIVTGAKVPILLTSRADPPAARLASVALSAIATNAATKSE